jgi:cyclic-di-AMP phosphodiesterase PgpH
VVPLLQRIYTAFAWLNNQTKAVFRGNSRAVIIVSFVIATVAILPRESQDYYETAVGRTWQDANLLAPYDMAVLKSNEQLKDERRTASDEVTEIFVEELGQRERNRKSLAEFYERLIALAPALRSMDLSAEEDAMARLNLLTTGLNPNPDPKALTALVVQGVSLEMLKHQALSVYDSIYRVGYIDRPSSNITHPLVSLRPTPSEERLVSKSQLMDNAAVLRYIATTTGKQASQQASRLMYASLVTWCKPNFLFNDKLYLNEREARRAAVIPYQGKVREGQLIITRGQTITNEASDVLRTLNQDVRRNHGSGNFWLKLLGQLTLVIVLTMITTIFLRSNRREIYFRNKKIALIFLTIFLMTALAVVTFYLGERLDPEHRMNYYFLVPLSMGGILTTVFFDARVGFFSNIVIGLLAGLVYYDSFEYFFIQACAGSIAVFNVSAMRRRAQFFTSSGALVLTYWTTYLGYYFYTRGGIAQVQSVDLAFLLGNVILTLATYPLIYLFERVMGMTSDLTYMELLDTDHPLLKELAMKAPGTYQHSLQVANISEEIAKRLDANTLEVRVGALFHDIGKLDNPEYFGENQRGSYNPHENLTPLQSAEIIIKHVPRGKEMAEHAGLPKEVIDFIRTHHGNSRLEFFYHKHIELYGSVPPEMEHHFRYPGPLPATKEQAIVMIADSIEAASRTLVRPTPSELEAFVDRIVSNKIRDNQMNHARITFRDLNKMKREIVKILQSIYHSRVLYPDQQVQPEPIGAAVGEP